MVCLLGTLTHLHKLFTVLHLNDFVTCRKRYYYQSEWALEPCRKMKFRSSFDTNKQNLFVLSLLSDFVACNKSHYI